MISKRNQVIIDGMKTKHRRELFDAQGNRLFRLKDLRKILTAQEGDIKCPDCSQVDCPYFQQDTNQDNDRDYEIAKVLERELDDSVTIANIMSGIQHVLQLTAQEGENVTKSDKVTNNQAILEIYGWWHEKPEHPAMIKRWERDAIGLYEDWQDAPTAPGE